MIAVNSSIQTVMERTTTAATDRELGASSPRVGLRADPEERLARTPAIPSWARGARGLALFGAFALHALVVAFVIFGSRWDPVVAPTAQEIPVEIIVEPRPPKPPAAPAPNPEPSIKTQALDEPPAHDAPRAANDEKVEREAPDEKTKAPVSEAVAKTLGEEAAPDKPAPPARESEAKPAPQPPQPAPDKAADSADGALDANSQSEEAEPSRAATPAPPDRVATFVGQPLPSWSKGGPVSTFDPVPDVELGSAASETTVAGGKAKATYLTVLYGKIMAHVHYASSANGGTEGEIVFVVDGTGRVVQKQVSRPSNSKELDAAALGAVAEAGPFPPPPHGEAVRLKFTYGSK